MRKIFGTIAVFCLLALPSFAQLTVPFRQINVSTNYFTNMAPTSTSGQVWAQWLEVNWPKTNKCAQLGSTNLISTEVVGTSTVFKLSVTTSILDNVVSGTGVFTRIYSPTGQIDRLVASTLSGLSNLVAEQETIGTGSFTRINLGGLDLGRTFLSNRADWGYAYSSQAVFAGVSLPTQNLPLANTAYKATNFQVAVTRGAVSYSSAGSFTVGNTGLYYITASATVSVSTNLAGTGASSFMRLYCNGDDADNRGGQLPYAKDLFQNVSDVGSLVAWCPTALTASGLFQSDYATNVISLYVQSSEGTGRVANTRLQIIRLGD